MREMHDYSASKFLVAHQGFSKLMEACVDGVSWSSIAAP